MYAIPFVRYFSYKERPFWPRFVCLVPHRKEKLLHDNYSEKARNFSSSYAFFQIDGAVQYHSMNLMYFDRLLMKNVTGNAICQTPTTSPTTEVSCGKKSMTVKLPAGTHRTMRVLG